MSILLLAARENPGPGLAVACLNLTVAVALICVSLFLAITISLLAWSNAIAGFRRRMVSKAKV
jgi:hypothetical protein